MMKIKLVPKVAITLSIIRGIFVVSLILSLFLWSIPLFSFNSRIWTIFQERSDVTLDIKDVKSYNHLIVNFFLKGVNPDFLNEREISHMQDVRRVLTGLSIIFTFSFIIMLLDFFYLSKAHKRFLITTTRKVSIGVFLVTLLVSILIMINFNWAFLGLHKLVFMRNFIFPADSLLKILYPDSFFLGLSSFYLISILIVSLVVIVISYKLKLK